MKNRIISLIKLLVLIGLYFATSLFADDPPQNNYIGSEACGKCHKSEKQGKQLTIWKESIHAHAYVVLNTEEAAEVAKEMGYDKSPAELHECLVCHASGYDVEETRLGKKFNIEDGIQCETCHGAGSEYKSLKVMKNRNLAVQNGLVEVFDETEEFCRSCHNPDSPTYSGFDFETMWAKIEHYLPVKKNEK